MQVKDLFLTGAIKQPWPLMVNGVVVGSSEIGISETCKKKCGVSPACSGITEKGEHTCKHGLSFLSASVANSRLTVYGMRGEANTTPLNLYNRAGLKGRSITRKAFAEWLSSIRALLQGFEQEFMQRQSEMLDPLHDPMRLAKQVLTISNRLVQADAKGASYDAQVENASIELKTLVKAAGLLNDSFDLLAIYFNPAAATYGEVTSISIHGLLTKLTSIFRIDDNGVTKSVSKIYLSGECFRNVSVYESFKLIPFALLANAVKYSIEAPIRVRIEDLRPVIRVSVESTGPYIEECERELIFQRKGRGKWASELEDGKGVGLYLAAVIAKAHGFKIDVSSTKNGKKVKADVPLAVNVFSFEIDPGAPLP